MTFVIIARRGPVCTKANSCKGVGSLLTPPKFLEPNDKIEVWIEKIGTLVHGVEFD